MSVDPLVWMMKEIDLKPANISFIVQLFVGKMSALDLYSSGNRRTLTVSVCGHQHKKTAKNTLTTNHSISGFNLQL